MTGLFLLTVFLIFSACADESTEVPFWVSVNGTEVFEEEVMLYLYETYEEFEDYGGKDVWLNEDFSGGRTAAEMAMQGAAENMIRNKILALKAQELGVVLDDASKASLTEEAMIYYGNLPENFIKEYHITEASVEQIFAESLLGEKVADRIMVSNLPSDEEIDAYVSKDPSYMKYSGVNAVDVLTSYRVQHLVVRTHAMDEDGIWQPMDTALQQDAKDEMDALYIRLEAGEDFFGIVREASQSDYYLEHPDGVVYSRSQLPADFREELDSISENEMTGVIQGQTGYHVFYLVEKNEPGQQEVQLFEERLEKWEEDLRSKARDGLVKASFEKIYRRWRDEAQVSYGEPWDAVDFNDVMKILQDTGDEE